MMLDGLTVTVVFWLICRIRMRMMGWDYTSVYRSTQIMLVMLVIFVTALLPLHKNILKRGLRQELREKEYLSDAIGKALSVCEKCVLLAVIYEFE